MRNIISKINFRKVLSVFVWTVIITGLVAALGFVNKKEESIPGKKILVNIDYSNGELFLDREDILQFLKSRNDTLNGKLLKQVDVNRIEKALRTHPAIDMADVSLTIDGNMLINIKQREPVLRIYLPTGESFYLDKRGKFMPLSENYSSRVIVANGNITQPFSSLQSFQYEKVKISKSLTEAHILDDLFEVTQTIIGDSLMSALTDQIIINEKNEFEIIPSIGDLTIIIGENKNLETKFQKLKIFFREGMTHVNGWNHYSSINLKYDGQVICTKKENKQPENKIPQP